MSDSSIEGEKQISLTYNGQLLVKVNESEYGIEGDEKKFSLNDVINATSYMVYLAMQAGDPVLKGRNKVTTDIELLLNSPKMVKIPEERLKLYF